MERQTDGRTDRWTSGWIDGQTDGQMDRWMDEWTDGWIDGGNFSPFYRIFPLWELLPCFPEEDQVL